MPWARRGERQYFYESVRIDGRPTRRYVGSGKAAEAAAARVEQRRQERERERRQAQEDRQRQAESISALDDLAEMTDLLMKATLVSNGFHQHARTWRRKRNAG